MHKLQFDGVQVTKWIMVLPVFLFTLLFLRVGFKYVVDLAVINNFTNPQTRFVLSHLYTDLFCMAFAIAFSCMLAPNRKATLAALFMALVLITLPKQLETGLTVQAYGGHAWKKPFLVTLHLASGLIPLLYFIWNSFRNRTSDKNRAA